MLRITVIGAPHTLHENYPGVLEQASIAQTLNELPKDYQLISLATLCSQNVILLKSL